MRSTFTFPSRPLRAAALAALLGGLSLGACSPSVNQAYKASIDQRLAALASSGQRYEAPASAEPMPLAVGQWSRYKLVDDEGRPGFMTYKVVGEQDGAWWLEIVSESYVSRTISLALMDLGNRRDPSTFDVKQMKTKTDDNAVQELPESVVGLMRPLWKPMVDSLTVDWAQKPQEPAEAPAGAFDACYRVRASVAFAGSTWTSDGWSHPAVPINGTVKARGVDNRSSLDLVEFGLSGAQSELL